MDMKEGKKKALHILIASLGDGIKRRMGKEDDDEMEDKKEGMAIVIGQPKEDDFTRRIKKLRGE